MGHHHDPVYKGQEVSRGLAAAKDPSGLWWEGLEFCRPTWVLLATPRASGKWCAHSHECNKKPEGTTRRVRAVQPAGGADHCVSGLCLWITSDPSVVTLPLTYTCCLGSRMCTNVRPKQNLGWGFGG